MKSPVSRHALLLANEPTGNPDRKNAKEIPDMLKLSNRSLKQTILLITHDEKAALAADRIVTMEDGDWHGRITGEISGDDLAGDDMPGLLMPAYLAVLAFA